MQASRRAALLAAGLIAVMGDRARASGQGAFRLSSGSDDVSLARMTVQVAVEGRLARTRASYTIDNDRERMAEAIIDLELPRGAAVTGLSMEVAGEMRSGRLLHSDRARGIYERIVSGRKDPALVEWVAEDNYRLTVFPVPPMGRSLVVVDYEQLLPVRGGKARYQLDLPAIAFGSLSFSLTARRAGAIAVASPRRAIVGEESVGYAADNLRSPAPIQIAFDAPPDGTIVHYARTDGQTFFVVEALAQRASRRPRRLVIAIDTSRSMKRQLADAVEIARGLAAALRDVRIVHGDLTARRCKRGQELACLARLDAAGGSNLEALVARALAQIGAGPADVVLLSDGRPSVGADGATLVARIARRTHGKPIAVHAIALGEQADGRLLSRIAEQTGGQFVARGEQSGPELAARLFTSSPPAARPRALRGQVSSLATARAGDTIVVAGKLASASAILSLGAGRRVQLRQPEADGDVAYVRQWAHLVSRVLDRDAASQLSLIHGVVAERTAFLVVERDEQYDLWPLRRARVPQVRIGMPMVHGDLDKRMIRRTVILRRNQVDHCYQRALRRDPGLTGTVVVSWEIHADGSVRAVRAGGGVDRGLEACVASVHREMSFPAAGPGSYAVAVNYPYTFVPARRPLGERVSRRRSPAKESIESVADELRALADAGDIGSARERLSRWQSQRSEDALYELFELEPSLRGSLASWYLIALVNRIDSGDRRADLIDELIDTASRVGLESVAARRAASRCGGRPLDDGERARCARWLEAIDAPRARFARLAMIRDRIEELSAIRDDQPEVIDELVEALDDAGDSARARRIESERAEGSSVRRSQLSWRHRRWRRGPRLRR